jgi:hypothetical protein
MPKITSHSQALAGCLALCVTASTDQKAAEAQQLAESIAAQMPKDIVAAVTAAVETVFEFIEDGRP